MPGRLLRPLPLFLAGLAVLGAALLTSLAGLGAPTAAAQGDPTPLPPRTDAILETILVRDPYTAWASWPTDPLNPVDFSGYLPGEGPHGTAIRLFVNATALQALADPAFAGVLPPGSLIVKENYGVTRDTPAALLALTVMAKIAGFDPAHGDWFWIKAAPDGATVTAEGAVTSCQSCHAESASDYLLAYRFPGTALLDGNAVIDQRCTVCHTRARIDAATKDAAGWTATIDRMVSYGAQLNDAERAALIAYLTSAAPPAAPSAALDADGLITQRCTSCHTRAVVDRQQRTASSWERVLTQHAGMGVTLSDAERAALIAYLTGTATPAAPPLTAGLDAESLINTRCTVCHTRARIDKREDDLQGWTEKVDRMIGYGAQLSPQERQTLIAYLAATHGKDRDDDKDDDD